MEIIKACTKYYDEAVLLMAGQSLFESDITPPYPSVRFIRKLRHKLLLHMAIIELYNLNFYKCIELCNKSLELTNTLLGRIAVLITRGSASLGLNSISKAKLDLNEVNTRLCQVKALYKISEKKETQSQTLMGNDTQDIKKIMRLELM